MYKDILFLTQPDQVLLQFQRLNIRIYDLKRRPVFITTCSTN